MAKNYISNKDETVRMFNNDLMESLSRVHPAVPLIVYTPVILFFLFRSVITFKFTFITVLTLILLGLAVWTIAEYTLHRFIFHYEPKSKFGEKIHFIFHGVHHDYPSDSRRLVMPPSVSIPLAVLFYFLFGIFMSPEKNTSASFFSSTGPLKFFAIIFPSLSIKIFIGIPCIS